MRHLLKLEEIHAGYGTSKVLHGVNLIAEEGSSVALVGRNGVGKTTVVNSLLGIATISQGDVWLNGQLQGRMHHYTAARSGISVVPQGRLIIPNLTIEENLLLGSAVGRKGKWNIEEVYKLFPFLKERAQTPGTEISGGEQQMLAIGRALMSNPSVLILDEPSEGLAPVIVDQLAEIINGVLHDGTAILLIEQNLSLIARVAKEYHVLSKGIVVESGSMDGFNIEELHRHIMI